jgi:hypothetical protein
MSPLDPHSRRHFFMWRAVRGFTSSYGPEKLKNLGSQPRDGSHFPIATPSDTADLPIGRRHIYESCRDTH